MNVRIGNGQIHKTNNDGSKVPSCGGNRPAEAYRVVHGEVTCKNCLKLMAAEADAEAAYQSRLAASMMPSADFHATPEDADQAPEIIEIRETAEDAADDARLEAAILRLAAHFEADELDATVQTQMETYDLSLMRDGSRTDGASAEEMVVVATEAEAVSLRAARQAARRDGATATPDLAGRTAVVTAVSSQGETYTLTVRVKEVVRDFIDPLTNTAHAFVVRYTREDSRDGYPVHLVDPLHGFLSIWWGHLRSQAPEVAR